LDGIDTVDTSSQTWHSFLWQTRDHGSETREGYVGGVVEAGGVGREWVWVVRDVRAMPDRIAMGSGRKNGKKIDSIKVGLAVVW
jgi:hypothetical protein